MKHQRVGLSESSQNAPKPCKSLPPPPPVSLHSDEQKYRAGFCDTELKAINESDNESERDDSGPEMEAEMEDMREAQRTKETTSES